MTHEDLAGGGFPNHGFEPTPLAVVLRYLKWRLDCHRMNNATLQRFQVGLNQLTNALASKRI